MTIMKHELNPVVDIFIGRFSGTNIPVFMKVETNASLTVGPIFSNCNK